MLWLLVLDVNSMVVNGVTDHAEFAGLNALATSLQSENLRQLYFLRLANQEMLFDKRGQTAR